MPDLSFAVEGADAVAFAAIPTIAVAVRITNAIEDQPIQSIALRTQILIDAARRSYDGQERKELQDLFGGPHQWARTLRPLLWTHAHLNVPAFQGSSLVHLPVACTFDFNVAATKYFHGVSDGDIPLLLQFSGTVFYRNYDGSLQAEQIPWDRESRFALPAAVWKSMMDLYYPNSAWLRLPRDVFERLLEYKTARGLATFEDAISKLLGAKETAA